jgi:serine/threonine-protein kinase PknK
MSWSPPGETGQTLIPGLQGYTDLQLIAHGSTAMVFRATQNRLNRTVAIKVLLVDDVMTTAANVARELETTVALSSQPHIVSIIDTGNTADGSPYIVMEYCEGGSYAQILKRRGPLPVGEVLEVGVKIGEALHAAHDVGIIHRDVKPPNILRSRFGPALTDFGIARAADDGGVATSTLDKLTPQHASPEALLRGHQSGRSDLYSLASTMWNLLVGRAPFADPEQPRMDPLAFRQRVLDAPVPRVPRDDVPEWLQQELARAMAKDPAERHGSAGEFANMLRLLGSRTEAPEAAPSGGEEPLIWPSAQPVRTSQRPTPAADPDAPETEVLGSQTAGAELNSEQSGGSVAGAGQAGGGVAGAGPAGAGAAAAGWPAESAVPPFSATPAGISDWPAPYTVPEHEPRYIPQPGPDTTAPPTVFPASAPPAAHPSSAPPSYPTSAPPSYPTSAPPAYPTSAPPSAYPASGPPAAFPPHAAFPASAPPGPPPPMFPPVSAPPSDAYPAPYTPTPAPQPAPRGRSLVKPLLVAGAIGVTLGLATTIGIVASRDGKQAPEATDPTPSPTALTPGSIDLTKEGAPRDLRIEDAGTSVTLHWVDTTGGKAPFIVFGARDGQQTRVLKKEERGQNSTVVDGLTPRADYCFVVAAAVSAEKLANSDSACTRRLGGKTPS